MFFSLCRTLVFLSLFFACGPKQMMNLGGDSSNKGSSGNLKLLAMREEIGHKQSLKKTNPGYSSFTRQAVSSKKQAGANVYYLAAESNVDCSLPVGAVDSQGNFIDVSPEDMDAFASCKCSFKLCKENMNPMAYAVQKKRFGDYLQLCQILKESKDVDVLPVLNENCGPVQGCTEPSANGFVQNGAIVGSYNPKATQDDGSCRFTACSTRAVNYQLLKNSATTYANKHLSNIPNFQLSSIFLDIKNTSVALQCNVQADPCFINGTCKEANEGCAYQFPSAQATFNQFINNYASKWYDNGKCQYDLNTYSTNMKTTFQQNYTAQAKYFSPTFTFDTKVPGVNLRNTSGMGCTDPMAYNYDENVTNDDCSCKYDACTDMAYEEFTYSKTINIYTNVGSYINTNRCNDKNPNSYIIPQNFSASCTRKNIGVKNIQSCVAREFASAAAFAGMPYNWTTSGAVVDAKYYSKVIDEKLLLFPGELSGNFNVSLSKKEFNLGVDGSATLLLGKFEGSSFVIAAEIELSNSNRNLRIERREDKLFVFKDKAFHELLDSTYLLTENSCCFSKDSKMVMAVVLKGHSDTVAFHYQINNACAGVDINSQDPAKAQLARACQWREDNNTAKACGGSSESGSTDDGNTDSTDSTDSNGTTTGTTDSGSDDGDNNGGSSLTHNFTITKLDTTVPYLNFVASKYNHQGTEDYLASVGVSAATMPTYKKNLSYSDYRVERLSGVDCIGRAHYRYDGWTCDVKVGNGSWMLRKPNAVTCICIPNDADQTPSLQIKNCKPNWTPPNDPEDPPADPPTPPNPPNPPNPPSR